MSVNPIQFSMCCVLSLIFVFSPISGILYSRLALEAIGIVDSSITKFYDDMIKTYPNNSFSAISLMVDESWEKVKLGEFSLFEISISTPGLYYVFYGLIEGGKVDCETE